MMNRPQARMLPSLVAAVIGVALLVAGCTGGGDSDDQAVAPSDGPPGALPQGSDDVRLEPAAMSADIDNPFWPMKPRTRWTYREIDEDGAVLRVVVTVTSKTKKIANGVRARIVRDSVTEDGELIEDTFDWYAQDAAGNVWYLGENTAEFEDGKLTTREGSFEAGVDGALAGVVMPGDPAVGMRYRQEYYKGHAEDNGAVLSLHEQVQVPFGHFKNALLTKDTNRLEPKVAEYKLFARGVGPVLALGISGGGGREELLKVDKVSARAARRSATAPLGRRYP